MFYPAAVGTVSLCDKNLGVC